MMQHIHRAAEDIEMKKFFDRTGSGGSLRRLLAKQAEVEQAANSGSNELGDLMRELNNDLGEAITDVIRKGNYTDEQQKALREVLTARFGGGRAGMNNFLHNYKSGITALKLGQIDSTMTQFGDFYASFAINGFMPTIKALARRGAHDIDDLGVNNIIAQDVRTNFTRMDDYTDKLLDWTQFKRLDRVGKRTFIRSAENRLSKAFKKVGGKGEQKFRKQWGDVYSPEELDAVIDGFRSGVKNDHTAMHLFHELSDIQPISSLEMPALYLNRPNARIMYTLKSFIIKQMDIARRAAAHDGTAAGRLEAMKKLANLGVWYGGITGLTEEAKDFVRGGSFEAEDIPDNFVEAILDLYHLNRYATERTFNRGDIIGWGFEFFKPPLPEMVNIVPPLFKDVFIDDDSYAAQDRMLKVLRDMPVAGRIAYGWTPTGSYANEDAEYAQEDAWYSTRR
jgi:hypothetical protein